MNILPYFGIGINPIPDFGYPRDLEPPSRLLLCLYIITGAFVRLIFSLFWDYPEIGLIDTGLDVVLIRLLLTLAALPFIIAHFDRTQYTGTNRLWIYASAFAYGFMALA